MPLRRSASARDPLRARTGCARVPPHRDASARRARPCIIMGVPERKKALMTTRFATYYAYRTPHGPSRSARAKTASPTSRSATRRWRASGVRASSPTARPRSFWSTSPANGAASTCLSPPREAISNEPSGTACSASLRGDAHRLAARPRHRQARIAPRDRGGVRRNPLAVLVPDHRVVDAHGRPPARTRPPGCTARCSSSSEGTETRTPERPPDRAANPASCRAPRPERPIDP